MSNKLKILTCNVRGIANPHKRRKIFRYLHEKDIDVIFMQETHSTKNCEKRWRNEWGGRIFFDHGESNARGTAIFFKKQTQLKHLNTLRSREGRFVMVEAELEDKKFLLANIYGPNVDDPLFFSQIMQTISESSMDFKIVGGDLNVILNPEMDKYSLSSKKTETAAVKFLNNFMEEEQWLDVWRIINPDARQYTWKRNTPLTMSRLDYLFMASRKYN